MLYWIEQTIIYCCQETRWLPTVLLYSPTQAKRTSRRDKDLPFAEACLSRTDSLKSNIKSSAEGLVFSAVRFARAARVRGNSRKELFMFWIKKLWKTKDWKCTNLLGHKLTHRGSTQDCHACCSCIEHNGKMQSCGKHPLLLGDPLQLQPDKPHEVYWIPIMLTAK